MGGNVNNLLQVDLKFEPTKSVCSSESFSTLAEKERGTELTLPPVSVSDNS